MASPSGSATWPSTTIGLFQWPSAPGSLAIGRGTISGFLRIATHPAIFPDPLSPKQAIEAITALLERPHVRTPAELSGFWQLYRATAGEDTRGNEVPGAHLAALMRQHGVTVIYTRDRDLRRYEGLDVRDPFQ